MYANAIFSFTNKVLTVYLATIKVVITWRLHGSALNMVLLWKSFLQNMLELLTSYLKDLPNQAVPQLISPLILQLLLAHPNHQV